MRVYREPKTKRWYVDYYLRGQRYRYKAGSSRRAADQLRLRIESEINAGKHKPAAVREEISGHGKAGNTFRKLVEAFLGSYRSRGQSGYYASRAKVWLEHFGAETPVSDISPLQVERFRNERLEEVGPSSVRKDLISLGTMFRWAVGKSLCSENPADPLRVRRPSEPGGREVFLTEEEMERVKECSPKDVRRLVSWLVHSGMRLGEALKLRWNDLDKRLASVYVASGKTGKPRRIPYTKRLQEIVDTVPRQLRGDRVFSGPEGQPLDANAMSKQIKAAMIRAELPEASAHTLRHTFASRLAVRGVQMKAIADLLGQNVARTTARYMHLQPGELLRAMEALEKPVPDLPGNAKATTQSSNPVSH